MAASGRIVAPGRRGAEQGAGEQAAATWGDLFLARLSPQTRAALTPDQLEEIRRVAIAVAPGRHRFAWRVSLPAPLGGRRYYGVLLAGADRRGAERRAQERMMRRQRRRHRSARVGVQALAVGFALALLALMLMAGLVHAEQAESAILGIDGADDRTPIAMEEWPWTALGRVNREIGGHCTGVLVAPDLVLTAAHCLYNFEDGRWTIPMEVHFVAGYHRGEYRAHARGRGFTISPDWELVPARDKAKMGGDWALIELERSLGIRPVAISTRSFEEMKQAAADGALTVAGYNGDFSEILTEHRGCRLVDRAGGGLLLHDCDATFGSSGAPLLLTGPAGTEIIGLQSAVVELEDGRSFGAAVPAAAFRAAAENH